MNFEMLARQHDATDPLASFAQEFHHPQDASGQKLTYLCGHSLGLQAKSVAEYVEQELADWRRLGVLGHHSGTRPWIHYHELAASGLAELVGASATEVVAMNSLTVNLHLMMVSFFRPNGARNSVLIEKSAFPSDRYAIVSQLEFHGLSAAKHLVEVAPRPGEHLLRTSDLVESIEREAPRLGLVLLPGIQYLTGQFLELAPIIATARRNGVTVGIDLAHSIGNNLLQLHDWNADFAVWCHYKYLNAGPGAIGGCFVHQRHTGQNTLPRFSGWWGNELETRFRMAPEFNPAPGADGWQLSNPPILSTAPLLASLGLFQRAGVSRLREKSIALTGYLEFLIQELMPESVEIITPIEPEQRGCQLSLRLKRNSVDASLCQQRLIANGVIGDWREPNILRLAPTPLYNSFSDVWKTATVLAQALQA